MPKVERLIVAGSLHPPSPDRGVLIEIWAWMIVLVAALATLAYWGS